MTTIQDEDQQLVWESQPYGQWAFGALVSAFLAFVLYSATQQQGDALVPILSAGAAAAAVVGLVVWLAPEIRLTIDPSARKLTLRRRWFGITRQESHAFLDIAAVAVAHRRGKHGLYYFPQVSLRDGRQLATRGLMTQDLEQVQASVKALGDRLQARPGRTRESVEGVAVSVVAPTQRRPSPVGTAILLVCCLVAFGFVRYERWQAASDKAHPGHAIRP